VRVGPTKTSTCADSERIGHRGDGPLSVFRFLIDSQRESKYMASSVMVKNPEILGGAPVFAGTRMAALEEAKALVLVQCK
jgi:hypothetical protein